MGEQINDSFVIYPSMVAAIKKIPPEFRLEAYDALMEYGMTNVMPENLSWAVEALIISFTTGIQGAKSRREKNKQNGRQGGAPSGNTNAQKQQKENNPKQPKTSENNLNVSVDDDDVVSADVLGDKKELGNENKPCESAAPTQNSKIPTFFEVQSYCLERDNGIDPQTFIDYYTARGWQIDGRPIDDWCAIIRVWEKRKRPSQVEKPPGPAKNFIRHNYAPGELNRLVYGKTADEQAEIKILQEVSRRGAC